MTKAPPFLNNELAAVLRTVAQADFCEPATIAKAHGRSVTEELALLHATGLVRRQAGRRPDSTRTTLYSISAGGARSLDAYDAGFPAHLCAVASVPLVASARTAHLTTTGGYDGAELRPYQGRPGANQALSLPSRFGRHLRFRDGSATTTDHGDHQ